MATWYVDCDATGANNGTSWTDAWTALPTSTVSPGDTVYISGGPSGTEKHYARSAVWIPPNGTSGNRITYQIGQEAGHNGIAVFTASASTYRWVSGSAVGTPGFHVNILGCVGNGSDGIYHFKLVNYQGGVAFLNNFRFAYIDLGDIKEFGNLTNTSYAEIDHCYAKCIDMLASRLLLVTGTISSFDNILIHDNILLAPYISGDGADLISGGGNGISVYDNIIQGYYTSNYAGGQHQDGYQSSGGGDYLKFYRNYFVDCSNYGVYLEALTNDYSNCWIFNNIFCLTDPNRQASNPVGVAAGPQSSYSGPSPCTYSGIVIANNVFVDYGSNRSIGLGDSTPSPTGGILFTGCFITNNLFLNSAGTSTLNNTTSTISNNVIVSGVSILGNIVSYTEFAGTGNNLHLIGSATGLINQGLDMSQFFTSDMDGVTRPNGSAWDIGAYEYILASLRRLGRNPKLRGPSPN